MKYGIRLKGYSKKNLIKKTLYNNKYISAKIDVYNGTEFEYKVLKDNKRCKYIFIEPKNGSHYEYSNKHYPQIFFKKCLYAKDKEAALLGKYVFF